MWPSPPDPSRTPLVERVLGWLHGAGVPAAFDVAALEVTANVVMFVPLGLLLPWTRLARSPWLAVPAGLAFSAAIETTQLALPGRVSTVVDVLANTGGAALGAAVVVAFRALRARARRADAARVPPGPPQGPPARDARHPSDPS